MKKIQYPLFIFLFLFSANEIFAQVAKNIMVEHFTNTNCGICVSRNAQFYQNLENQNNPNIFHISYHPSSPYANCAFSVHNPSENDGRTNFYGLYGSTPKLNIQGENLSPLVGWSDATMFDSYVDQMSPLSIDIEQTKSASSIDVTIYVNAEVDNTLEQISMLVGVAEDTVFYTGGNGESEHYDVFRKGFTLMDGLGFTSPSTNGQSKLFTFSTPVLADWDLSRMYTYVILQDPTTLEVIQSQVIAPDATTTVITSLDEFNTLEGLSIYPNPTKDFTTIQLQSSVETKARVFNLLGELVMERDFVERIELDLSDFAQGAYFLEIENKEGKAVKKLIKE